MADLSAAESAMILTGTDLGVDTVVALARSEQVVDLADAAVERIAGSRNVLLDQQDKRLIYGRNSGVGALKNVPTRADVAADLQMLRSHATTGGSEVPPETVRAMMIIRLNQLAGGGSGVSVSAARRIVELVNDHNLPRVRRGGTLGTGDMPQLAALGLLVAEPTSDQEPSVASGALSQGDALGLISSSALTLADCALAGDDLRTTLKASTVVTALTWLVVRGNREHFSAAAAPALRTEHALRVAGWLAGLLADEDYVAPRVQETFALRVFPSSVGAVLGVLAQSLTITEELINARVENPLVCASSAEIVHHGGFYNLDLALALDGVAAGLSQVSAFVLSRVGLLSNTEYTGVADYLGDGSPGASGVMMLEYLAAWHLGRMRTAAGPVTLSTTPVSQNVEENTSFASLAADRVAQMSASHASMVACELVAAVRALRLARTHPCGSRLSAALATCAELPDDGADRDLSNDIAIAEQLLPALAALLD